MLLDTEQKYIAEAQQISRDLRQPQGELQDRQVTIKRTCTSKLCFR